MIASHLCVAVLNHLAVVGDAMLDHFAVDGAPCLTGVDMVHYLAKHQ